MSKRGFHFRTQILTDLEGFQPFHPLPPRPPFPFLSYEGIYPPPFTFPNLVFTPLPSTLYLSKRTVLKALSQGIIKSKISLPITSDLFINNVEAIIKSIFILATLECISYGVSIHEKQHMLFPRYI